jgi:hypothetical protein
MVKKSYVFGVSSRPDGFYAVIKDKSRDERIFERKCDNRAEAEQLAICELQRLKNTIN